MSESNHFAGHIGRETTVKALGQIWTLSRWDVDVWSEFAKIAKRHLPDPIALVMKCIDQVALKDAEIMRGLIKADVAEEQAAKEEKRQPVLMAPRYKQMADVLMEKALDKASSYLSFNSPEVDSFRASVPGTSALLCLLLRKHHPDMTEAKACDILHVIGEKEVSRVFREVTGNDPGPVKNA